MNLSEKVVLLTGGTGSFGKKFVELVLKKSPPKKLIIFSRDEFKQHEMKTAGFDHPCMRYFLGDVRDKVRLARALDGVNVVVHAAALKQITACEYNPIEAVRTNVMGAANIIDSAIDRNVEKVMVLSTDKAAAPANLYGATKLCAEKLFVAGNSYSGAHGTRFSVVRYGNVSGSRGSVIPLFLKMRETGCVPITDPRMTRFWLTLEEGVRFVLKCVDAMRGGEIFVPKIPSMKLVHLVQAIAPECITNTVGIRAGEKLHEVLLTEDEARSAVEYDDHFTIFPALSPGSVETAVKDMGCKRCVDGFRYTSDTNTQWLSIDELKNMIDIHQHSSDGDMGL
jgi:UDP-N-acetylglucosamine 4,6-dehydratase/5-epimerase